ncbi:MAG: helix-turn-helix domain-containing protein [Prevotella sp.]
MDNLDNKKEPSYLNLISPSQADELYERILRILVVGKKYRDKHYSAKQLSADLNTNTRYVSVVFNVRFHMNYTSLINKLRVDEAMSLLADKRYSKLKMQDISDMVGFTNRQSFYSAFCKFKGMTPLNYRKTYSLD